MTLITVPDHSYGDPASDQCDVDEMDVLSASPIACAVADAWWEAIDSVPPLLDDESVPLPLARALNAIESATRESPLRKVRP